MRGLVLVALAAALLAPCRALAEEGPAPWVLDFGWEASPIDPMDVATVARNRKHAGIFFTAAGGLAAVLGSSLMIGEAIVRPRPGDEKVWSQMGCELSFTFGMMLVPWGVHLLATGLGMVARGQSLEQLHKIMMIEGPSPFWLEWNQKAKALRISGNILSIVGTAFLTMGLELYFPYSVCERWKCHGWPHFEECPAESGSTLTSAGIGFMIVGVVTSALGIGLMVTGYARQAQFLRDRHEKGYAPPAQRVLLSFSPGGLSLAW